MKREDITLPTYVINLPERTDRRHHAEAQFAHRPEFSLHIFPAVRRPRGADGLWESIRAIVSLAAAQSPGAPVLICEDDHTFTPHYDRAAFLADVALAGRRGCQLLLGGIGNFRNLVPVSERLFWVDWFWCTQFMVVYPAAFEPILQSTFGPRDVADEFLAHLLPNKMVLHPFVSVQREFGYSDVTRGNDQPGRMEGYFSRTAERCRLYSDVARRYGLLPPGPPAAT